MRNNFNKSKEAPAEESGALDTPEESSLTVQNVPLVYLSPLSPVEGWELVLGSSASFKRETIMGVPIMIDMLAVGFRVTYGSTVTTVCDLATAVALAERIATQSDGWVSAQG